jgi:hypothetical protein
MRALSRRILAPLLVAAAVFSSGQQIYMMAVSAAPAGGMAVAACPFGTHWEVTTQTCQ